MPSQSQVKAGHAYILVEALDKTSAVFKGITRHLDALSQKFLFASRQAAILGAALMLPLVSSANSARDFSDEVLFLQSVLGATDKQMNPLIDKIKTLGRTTSFTATEVATAATALAQGGFGIDKIMNALGPTLDMARGARMELGKTADILVDTLTLFHMEADQAAEVADKFFLAARNGTIDVADLAQSFSYTALSAAEMGFNLDQTLSILAEMSKRMLKSTKAGTSLNQFITSLASNIEKVNDKEKLGIEVFDDMGEPRNALAIIRDFANAVNSMPTEKRIPVIEEIFNVRGARAATAIARSLEGIFKGVEEMGGLRPVTIEALNKFLTSNKLKGAAKDLIPLFESMQKMTTREAVPFLQEKFGLGVAEAEEVWANFIATFKGSTDIALEAARKMDSGIGGSMRRMVASINLLKIEFGLGMESVLKDVEDTIGPVIRGLTIWVKRNTEVVRETLKVTGAIIGFAIATAALGISLRVLSFSLVGLNAILSVLTLPFRLVRGLSLLVASAFVGLATTTYNLVKSLVLLPVTIAKLTKSLIKLAASGLAAATKGLKIFIRLLLSPITLVFQLARGIINLTRNFISLSISIARTVVESVLALARTFWTVHQTLASVVRSFVEWGLMGANVIAELGQVLIILGRQALQASGMILQVMAAMTTQLATMTGQMLTGMFSLISTTLMLSGNLAVLLGTIMTIAPEVIVFAAIAAAIAAIGIVVFNVTKKIAAFFGKIMEKSKDIVVSVIKIGNSIVSLGKTAVSFVSYLAVHSFDSLKKTVLSTFSAVASSSKRMWDDLTFVATESYATMKAVIESGDLERAWEIALRALKFIWESTVIEMNVLWEVFTTEAQILFRNLMMELDIAWMKFRGRFKEGINEIMTELENIASAFSQVFTLITESITSVMSLIAPTTNHLGRVVSALIGKLSDETKYLFDEIRRGQRLDAELASRGPSPEELELERQINVLRMAAEMLDESQRAMLQDRIDHLIKAKEALRSEYLRDLSFLGPTATFTIDPKTGKMVPGASTETPPTIPPEFMSVMQDIARTTGEIPQALEKGSMAAAEKAFQNQQTSLLSRAVGLLASIDAKTEKGGGGSLEDLWKGIPPGAVLTPVGVGPV